MAERVEIVEQVDGLFRIIALNVLRRTPGVFFDTVPVAAIPRIDGIDRVFHDRGAYSPGSVGEIERPWYWHPHQQDHLIVLHG
ncbi:MAG: hypothetical protein ACYS8K_10395, partial [Planctomycetota bacterium]